MRTAELSPPCSLLPPWLDRDPGLLEDFYPTNDFLSLFPKPRNDSLHLLLIQHPVFVTDQVLIDDRKAVSSMPIVQPFDFRNFLFDNWPGIHRTSLNVLLSLNRSELRRQIRKSLLLGLLLSTLAFGFAFEPLFLLLGTA